MATNKETTIDKLIISEKVFIKSIGDYRYNVITGAHWTCTLKDSDTGIQENVHGTTRFQYPDDPDGFVEYSDITKTTVLSWLDSHPDIEYRVSRVIDMFNKRVANAMVTNSIPTIVNFDNLPD